jgi:hypothetical protein
MPRGKGIYARGDLRGRVAQYALSCGLDFVALTPNLMRSDAAECRAAGLDVYVYSTPAGDGDPSTPDSWQPGEWRRTIPAFEALCEQYGARGYYADTEWAGRDNRAEVIAMAERLRASDSHSREVILTDFWADEVWKFAGPICGDKVALSLQLYDIDRPAARIEEIYAQAKSLGWRDVYHPSVPAYRWVVVEGPNYTRKLTPEEFTRYTRVLGAVDSAIIWYSLPAPAGALQTAIAQWSPESRGIALPFVGAITWETLAAIVLAIIAAIAVVLIAARSG